jgi:uncharacterized membrane protein YhaH (DUF805 family)
LFSSTGRIGRGTFVALALLLLALTVAFEHLVAPPAYGWARWIVYPAVLFSGACVLCKRLHDRGRRGWWAGLILWALWICWSSPRDPGLIPPAAILLIAGIDLVVLPGQKAFNRFGPARA